MLNRLIHATIGIALVVFLCGGGDVLAAIQGTSVTTVNTNKAMPYPDGIRVGHWPDSTSGKLGSFVFSWFRQEWAAPAAVTSHTVKGALSLDDSDVLTTDCSGVTAPDFSRSVAVWVNWTESPATTEALSTTLTFTGTDFYDQTISYQLSCSLSSPSVTRLETLKAFKTLTAITWTAPTVTGATTPSLDIAYGDRLGLEWRLGEAVCIELEDANGTGGAGRVATAGTIYPADTSADTPTATTNDWRGMWEPNDKPDGTSDYVLYYISTDILQRHHNDPVKAEYGR